MSDTQSKLSQEHKEEVGGLTGGFIEPTDRFTRKEILLMVNQLSQTKVSVQVVSGNQTKQEFDVQSGLQLPHCNLAGLDLRHLQLKRANFTGSNLEGTKFDEGRLESASFEWSNLKGARFVRSDLKKANLKVCIIHCIIHLSIRYFHYHHVGHFMFGIFHCCISFLSSC